VGAETVIRAAILIWRNPRRHSSSLDARNSMKKW
jgi:hypothetical protein